MPLTMDISTALYVGIGLIVCAFLLIAATLRPGRGHLGTNVDGANLHAVRRAGARRGVRGLGA